MQQPDLIKELKENPNGDFTKMYLEFLREMRPEWMLYSDVSLIKMALIKLGAPTDVA